MSCVSIRVPQHRSLSRVPEPRSWLGLGGRPLDLTGVSPQPLPWSPSWLPSWFGA